MRITFQFEDETKEADIVFSKSVLNHLTAMADLMRTIPGIYTYSLLNEDEKLLNVHISSDEVWFTLDGPDFTSVDDFYPADLERFGNESTVCDPV